MGDIEAPSPAIPTHTKSAHLPTILEGPFENEGLPESPIDGIDSRNHAEKGLPQAVFGAEGLQEKFDESAVQNIEDTIKVLTKQLDNMLTFVRASWLRYPSTNYSGRRALSSPQPFLVYFLSRGP
jgi:hypothetical protein